MTTEDPQTVETYVGVKAKSFKKRFGRHKTSFNNPTYAGDTMLSTHIWNLKKENKTLFMHCFMYDGLSNEENKIMICIVSV